MNVYTVEPKKGANPLWNNKATHGMANSSTVEHSVLSAVLLLLSRAGLPFELLSMYSSSYNIRSLFICD